MYLGIPPLSVGLALLDEAGTGFAVCGLCLLIIGLMQECAK